MADTDWLDSFMQRFDGLFNDKTKDEILDGWQQVGDFSKEELSQWLKGVVQRLDELVDEAVIQKLMESCGHECAEMHNAVEKAIEKRRQFASLDEYLEAEQIERDGQILYLHYTPSDMGLRCYCSLWHGLQDDENASLTWCNCSRSHVEKIWTGILEKPAKVTLLKSCIAGDQECKFAIHL